jgi:hypothetical protein
MDEILSIIWIFIKITKIGCFAQILYLIIRDNCIGMHGPTYNSTCSMP